jgi:excisionase family DNA binding protein
MGAQAPHEVVQRMLLRVWEVAERLAISKSQTYLMVASGQLPTVRIGRAVRVPERALLDWVDAKVAHSTNPPAGPSP